MDDFQAQRAAINAELTHAALTGGDTNKIRTKLAQLEAREATERQAQAQRDAAAQQ